jgi:hypothetical protein
MERLCEEVNVKLFEKRVWGDGDERCTNQTIIEYFARLVIVANKMSNIKLIEQNVKLLFLLFTMN